MRMVKDLSSALDEFLRDFDRDIWVELMIHRNWQKIGGKRKPSSIRFKDGILKISAFDSTLRNYLIINKERVLNVINEILGSQIVNDIEVFGGQTPIFKMFSSPLLGEGKKKKR